MSFCRYCGHQLSENAVFCVACGKMISNNAAEQPGAAAFSESAGSADTNRYKAEINGSAGMPHVLDKDAYFSTLASEDTRVYHKKMIALTSVLGVVSYIVVLIMTILGIAFAFGAFGELPVDSSDKIIIVFSSSLYAVLNLASVILSVTAVQKVSLSMAWGSFAFCATGGIVSYFSGISSVIAVNKLNSEYKKYLFEIEGRRY
ncbi:MAG: zinc ribbon domain-containing protein [Clostridia bacterium]|nr:zinc ribbon domain-containing protein [Clostridia bacterium]